MYVQMLDIYISKISKKSKILDIFDIFENIMIFSIPDCRSALRSPFRPFGLPTRVKQSVRFLYIDLCLCVLSTVV